MAGLRILEQSRTAPMRNGLDELQRQAQEGMGWERKGESDPEELQRRQKGQGKQGLGLGQRLWGETGCPPAAVPSRLTVMLWVVVRAWMSAMLLLRWRARLKAALVAPMAIQERPGEGHRQRRSETSKRQAVNRRGCGLLDECL